MAGHGRGGRRGRGGGHGGGEHENSERWLLTYADMITLLVAFFIMLYAMSVMNVQKFQQLAISVRSGFGGSMTTGAPAIMGSGGAEGTPSIVSANQTPHLTQGDVSLPVPPKELAARQDQERLDKAYEVMRAYIKQKGLQSVMQVHQDERGVVVTVMTDQMLFARGDAALRPQEMGLLSQVASVVNTVPNSVRVEGHTDNLPINTPRFPSNWELSAMRATTVLRWFEGRGVTASRLEAAGCADQRPIVPNDTEAHRGMNRRVDVVILRQFPLG